MISTKVIVPDSLKKKLTKEFVDKKAEILIDKTSQEALSYVKEFGLGTGSTIEPFGGAPHWQGKVTVQGHYSGYLSDTHYRKVLSPLHAQIASDAEFVDGVLRGYSTNWHGHRFGLNNYPKRAVDKLVQTNLYGNRIQEFWKESMK